IRGEIIAFGGRIILSGEPKYLNSPETELFNKSHELYGLYEAQKSIRENKFVIVVEGYMDVIALQQFGIENVVATMGTSATEEHIKKLFRLCDDIYFCFDGDKAGRKAAWRALERSNSLVTDLKGVYFTFLPEQHDPDSYIRHIGMQEFVKTVKNASLTLSKYLLTELSESVNLKSEEGKAKLISLSKPYIEQTKAFALQVMLKKQLANMVELEPIVLESILNNRSRYAFYNSRVNPRKLPNTDKVINPKYHKIKNIIITATHHIDWVNNYRLPEDISMYTLELQDLILFLDFISLNYHSSDIVNINDILNDITFNIINIANILSKNCIIKLTENDFIRELQDIFGFSTIIRIRSPRILMKGNK
ncbi:MAG: toprim domain-containing protein, partial [Burkholderiales bacterium]|nr:toprim domain-containing protein [Burkholderiales bacterium]